MARRFPREKGGWYMPVEEVINTGLAFGSFLLTFLMLVVMIVKLKK
jgi:hypothetical protein